ncbi:MAG TPA: nucleotidyltransferase [Phycisphaerae bacterium]|nr:nucleotidyltransferase [Phycisphaerae bacterium]
MIIQEELLNDVLNQVAIELDIPPHKYKEAMERFDAIKRHLEVGDYPGSTPPPSIYLQGSFRLGTVIRPIMGGRESGFDIDSVCQVNRDKSGDNPENLKDEVGAEVKSYAEANRMEHPANGRRCWALNYASDSEGIGFHVDILPCLPDMVAGTKISQLNDSRDATDWQYTRTTIAITNRDDDATPPAHDWRSSNPIGFANWFDDICRPGYAHVDNSRQKELLFEAFGQRQNFPFRRAEDIPDNLVRTSLQRAIQIMKRHRDVRFNGHQEERHKPISMIITTLAARLYAGRSNQFRTTRSILRFIVEELAQHAALVDNRKLLADVSRTQLIRRVGDTWYIPNPVNPHNPGDPDDKGENFADRWHEDNHAKAKAFFQWVDWLRDDLDDLLNSNDVAGMEGTLSKAFGENIATRTLHRLGVKSSGNRAETLLHASSTALSRFDVPHRQKPTWPSRFTHDVAIEGRATRHGWRTIVSNNGFRKIAKDYSLLFKVKTNVPWPYDVHWQVVNTGEEARRRAQLRGTIFSGERERNERTEYTGFHWIECFIVKDGVLVARSGEFVVEIV